MSIGTIGTMPPSLTGITDTALSGTGRTLGAGDQDGVPASTEAGETAGGLPLPKTTTKADMMKFMAAFEDMIILLSKLAKEVQTGERENQISSLQNKVSLLKSAAAEKVEGADKMRAMAVVTFAVSLVAAGVSFIGAVGSFSSASSAVGKAADSATKAAATAADSASKAAETAAKTASTVAEGAAKADWGTLIQPLAKVGEAGAGFAGAQGQVANQKAQADADILQARAEEAGTQGARSQQVEEDMRDLLSKMVELLNSFYAAQDKIASAASH